MNNPLTSYIFFSGKGGVGKTTMASATAVHYALTGKKTLIVTTDPASNLSDIFEQEIGHRVTPVKGIGPDNLSLLSAMEIDPDEATREYKEGIIGPFRETMPDDVIASLEENLSGPCTTEMASFDRFIDFMERDDYDIIVFDTAPTGHTLRLLQLPVDWSKHIEESAKGSGRTCLCRRRICTWSMVYSSDIKVIGLPFSRGLILSALQILSYEGYSPDLKTSPLTRMTGSAFLPFFFSRSATILLARNSFGC